MPPELQAGSRRPGHCTEKETISISFVEEALQGVRARGMDGDALLKQVGISPALLRSFQARVSPTHYSALWLLIAEALDDEFFGQDSRRMKVGSFGMLCRTVVYCKTLGKALARALRFFDLILDDIRGMVSREANVATIALFERTQDGTHRIFAHETLIVMLHGIACWLVGRRIPILSAGFAYPPPRHSAEYLVLFSTRLTFDQPNTSFTFGASYLDLPVVQDEESVKAFLRIAPQNLLVKYKNTSSLTARIRKRLRQQLPDELPALQALATELHVTEATLRRRLQEEGESYQSIKDQLRRDLAITYLSHSERSVEDIALNLGFAEPSAFYRAFKKWTGGSPREYRKSLAAE
jgi:AraC-like DNA-binding protein